MLKKHITWVSTLVDFASFFYYVRKNTLFSFLLPTIYYATRKDVDVRRKRTEARTSVNFFSKTYILYCK